MDSHVLEWIGRFSYPAVFILIALTGVGAPISEELVLLAAGIVVAHGDANLGAMMVVGYLSVLVADQILYRVGRKLGPRAVEHKHLKKLLTPKRVQWIESHFARHGALTIFGVRFLPGLRAPTFLVAGISKMPMKRFLLGDMLATAITSPLLVWLGYRFGAHVLKDVRTVGKVLVGAVIAAIVAMIVAKVVRARRLKRGEADAAALELRRDLRRSAP